MPFVIKAVVQALKEYPYFNASLDLVRQEITHHHYYHIGIATTVPEGLLVPVIHHADQLSLKQLAQKISSLSSQARSRNLGLEDLSGSTFTITNFGSVGGEQGTPIINPPEVAILGMGRIEDKPVVIKGKVKARPLLPLSLSFDHRLLDGAAAAQFLGHIKDLLHDPNLLLLEL
jgi:pyruvate dehydrogenase E2 component (dihydrolipoamide acetyltransferase)